MALHHVTPLLRSTALSERLGEEVWLKMENAQPAASFKCRGMGRVAERAKKRGARALISSSGGNAGLAIAMAARQLDLPLTVIVPERTPDLMRRRIAAEGATVRVHGEVWDDAHALAKTLATDGTVLVHPFDDPDVWAGNATMVHEIVGAMPKPGCVVVSVGGGGLLLGVLQGLRDVGWSDVPVVAVETEGAASFAAGLEAGHPVDIGRIDTIALTLGAREVAAEAVVQGLAHPVSSVLVTDEAALDAVEAFLHDHRVLVEPACGASLSLVYDRHPGLKGPVCAIVCGGAAATLEQLAEWRAQIEVARPV